MENSRDPENIVVFDFYTKKFLQIIRIYPWKEPFGPDQSIEDEIFYLSGPHLKALYPADGGFLTWKNLKRTYSRRGLFQQFSKMTMIG